MRRVPGIKFNPIRNPTGSCGDFVEQLTFLLFLKWRMSSRERRSIRLRSMPTINKRTVPPSLGRAITVATGGFSLAMNEAGAVLPLLKDAAGGVIIVPHCCKSLL